MRRLVTLDLFGCRVHLLSQLVYALLQPFRSLTRSLRFAVQLIEEFLGTERLRDAWSAPMSSAPTLSFSPVRADNTRIGAWDSARI